MESRFFDPQRPRLIAHRGGSAHLPENTLPAFQAAIESGIQYLEFDIWITRDHRIIVHHDKTLLRTCNIDREISDLTLQEIKTLDAGHGFTLDGGLTWPFRGQGITVPVLEEILEAFPKNYFTIEIKQDSPLLDKILLKTIHHCQREDSILLASSHDTVMQRLRTWCDDIPTGFSYGEVFSFFEWLKTGCGSGFNPFGQVLHLPEWHGNQNLLSPQTVEAAHSIGLEIHAWTINHAVDMERLLRMGVDGITTDFPEILIQTAGKFMVE